MERIRIAQIGVEHDHAAAIMRALRALPEYFEVVGYCDPEEEVEYEPFTGQYTVAGYPYNGDPVLDSAAYEGLPKLSLEELLSIDGLTAVTVETSEKNLFRYAYEAAKRGLNVHMDKPGGTSLADFEKLVQCFRKTGKTLHLGYMYRYNPALMKLYDDVKAGVFGKIYSVECQMSTRHEDAKRAWMKHYQGGMMFFLGCHLLDVIYRLQGEPENLYAVCKPSGVGGLTEGQDFAFAALEYPGGVSFLKTCSVEPGGFLRRQIVICGENATAELKPTERHYDGEIQLSSVRYVKDNIFVWENDGETLDFYADRYSAMLKGFHDISLGLKENPYTMDYELGLFRLIQRACGMEEDGKALI